MTSPLIIIVIRGAIGSYLVKFRGVYGTLNSLIDLFMNERVVLGEIKEDLDATKDNCG